MEKNQSVNKQVVIFRLQDEAFAIQIDQVLEIVKLMPITIIPQAPEFVAGVMNLRGSIVPVVDLRHRFGFPKKEPDKLSRIILVKIGGNAVGLIVDSVTEVATVDEGMLQPPGGELTQLEDYYIEGVYPMERELVIKLDVQQIIPSM